MTMAAPLETYSHPIANRREVTGRVKDFLESVRLGGGVYLTHDET